MIVVFTVYIFSRIFKKRELSENIYNATFTVIHFWKSDLDISRWMSIVTCSKRCTLR